MKDSAVKIKNKESITLANKKYYKKNKEKIKLKNKEFYNENKEHNQSIQN